MLSYVTIFGRDIPLYGMFFYIGILVAAGLAVLLARKRQIASFDVIGSGVYVMIGAVLGAKLLFITVSMQEIIEYEVSFIGVIKGGFVFYGGLIGGAIGLLIYMKQFKLRRLALIDLYATVLPLGHAFGRVGCFFAGCCYGMPYDGFFSHVYTSTVGMTPIGVPLFAIQLLEALLLLCLFFVVFALFIYQARRVGLCGIVYMLSYAVLRFILEFFRGDKERGILLFSTSQWISLVIFISVTAAVLRRYAKQKRCRHQN